MSCTLRQKIFFGYITLTNKQKISNCFSNFLYYTNMKLAFTTFQGKELRSLVIEGGQIGEKG